MNEIHLNGIRVIWPARGENQGAEYKDREKGVLTLALTQELAEIIYTAIDQNPDFLVEENELFWVLTVARFWDKKRARDRGPTYAQPRFPIQDPNFKHLEMEWKFVFQLVDNPRFDIPGYGSAIPDYSADTGFKAAQIIRSVNFEDATGQLMPEWDHERKLEHGLENFLRASVDKIIDRLQSIYYARTSSYDSWNKVAVIQTICLLDLKQYTRTAFDQFCRILKTEDSRIVTKNIEQLAAALWPMLMQAVEMAANQWRNDLSKILADIPKDSIWEVGIQDTKRFDDPDYW